MTFLNYFSDDASSTSGEDDVQLCSSGSPHVGCWALRQPGARKMPCGNVQGRDFETLHTKKTVKGLDVWAVFLCVFFLMCQSLHPCQKRPALVAQKAIVQDPHS